MARINGNWNHFGNPPEYQIRDLADRLSSERADARAQQDWLDAENNHGWGRITSRRQIETAAYRLFQERAESRRLNDWFDAMAQLNNRGH